MAVEELSLSYYFEDFNDFMFPEIFEGIQYPWEAFAKAKEIFSKKQAGGKGEILGTVSESATITGWVEIGEGTVVGPNVSIEGPVIVGKNCKIGHGALIRPGTILSDGCIIGHGCEIKNDLVFKGAKLQSMTFVGDCVVGRGARVGSGTITANRRFDQAEVGIKYEGIFYGFGTEFFGCVLGDYARLGANSVTLPGTLVGSYTWVMPLTRVSGFVPKVKIISAQQEIIMKDNKITALKP